MSRVLVVDDDADIGRLVAEVLGDDGHEVQVLTGASALEETVRVWRPDVVLLDVNLPYFDIWAKLPLIAAMASGAVPVILMTGNRTAVSQAGPLGALGVVDLLFKPFELGELLAKVGSACGCPGLMGAATAVTGL